LEWIVFSKEINADRSGVFQEGVVKVHLRRWLEDEDAWTLARYICSPHIQREASGPYKSLQIYQLNSTSLIPEPDQASDAVSRSQARQRVFLRMLGPTPDNPRWLVLRIERCSAPFPFDGVIVDRGNNSTQFLRTLAGVPNAFQ
jgi:hypothetical protein